jgi:capsular polysaccharide biosynthesis protein
MELHYYLRIARRRWLLVIIGFLLTTALTYVFVDRQPLVYESKATFLIRPNALNSADGVRAVDALTRGVEISSTFATVARSDLIRQRAEARLASTEDTSGLSVESAVLTSTNILELRVTGTNPSTVHALARAIGNETVAYIADLQQVFGLQILDAPTLPDDPVAPNKPLLLGTGMVFGVAVGLVFALLAEGLSVQPRPKQFERQLAQALRNSQDFSMRHGPLARKADTTPTVSGRGNGYGADETLVVPEARASDDSRRKSEPPR